MKRLLPLLLLSSCASVGSINETPITQQKNECPNGVCENVEVFEEPVSTVSEEVNFLSHGDTLSGEILRPVGVSGPLPGILILHDFGTHNRDGMVRESFGIHLPVEVPIYRTMAEQLAALGFAVMIYDKRTCVEGGRVWCTYPRAYLNAGKDDLGSVLADDAQSAMKSFTARKDISGVSSIGHGQGAELALELSRRGVKMRSIAALSLSNASVTQQVVYQLRSSKEALETRLKEKNDAETDEMRKQLVKVEASLAEAKIAFAADTKNASFGGVDGTVWKSFDRLHEHALEHAQVHTIPLLVVIGTMDLNSPDSDEEKLKSRLGKGVRWESLDGVSHDLVDLTSDATTISQDLSQILVDFLKTPTR